MSTPDASRFQSSPRWHEKQRERTSAPMHEESSDLFLASILPQHAANDSLNLAVFDVNRLELRVCRLESDAIDFPEERLERGFTIRQQRHDTVTVGCGIGALDENEVPVEDAFIAHRVTGDL